MVLMSVDFPQPLGPRMATCSPAPMVRLRLRSAMLSPRMTVTFKSSIRGGVEVKRPVSPETVCGGGERGGDSAGLAWEFGRGKCRALEGRVAESGWGVRRGGRVGLVVLKMGSQGVIMGSPGSKMGSHLEGVCLFSAR